MVILSIYIVSKSGGLIYHYDQNPPKVEVEKVYSYPLPFKLEVQNKKVIVTFGEQDAVRVGHAVLAINGVACNGLTLSDGKDIMELLNDPTQYPLNVKFGRPPISTNDKLFLASMFYPLFAIACQLSPEHGSSGIQVLEADTFRMHCFQTLTGVKFLVLADPKQTGVENLLRKIYELYADYALKNPFYSLEMPIRCELFEMNLQASLEQMEKGGLPGT